MNLLSEIHQIVLLPQANLFVENIDNVWRVKSYTCSHKCELFVVDFNFMHWLNYALQRQRSLFLPINFIMQLCNENIFKCSNVLQLHSCIKFPEESNMKKVEFKINIVSNRLDPMFSAI